MRRGFLSELWRAIKGTPLSLAGLFIIIALVITAIVAPYVAPYNPIATAPLERLKPPSRTHPLGTDQLGRDILSRLLFGAQISLRIAGIVALFAGVSGTIIGLLCGYFGGIIDDLLMRITDIFMAFPQLILAMAISSASGPSLENVIIAISMTEWTVFARVARSRAVAIREETYVEAARAVGGRQMAYPLSPCPSPKHFPDHCAAFFGNGRNHSDSSESGLPGLRGSTPYAGMGGHGDRWPKIPSRTVVGFHVPGLAIFFTVLGFNLLGDGIRDVLDPRLRRGK
jgi:peptide/nickel transport system permease protein